MPKYRLTFDVKSVHGTQTFLVDAENTVEAFRKHQVGESEFESEEIEVMGLNDDPDIDLADEE